MLTLSPSDDKRNFIFQMDIPSAKDRFFFSFLSPSSGNFHVDVTTSPYDVWVLKSGRVLSNPLHSLPLSTFSFLLENILMANVVLM